MIEVKRAWVDEGNFEGFAILSPGTEDGIFVADQNIDARRGKFSSSILYAASSIIYRVRGDGLARSPASLKLDEFARDMDGLTAGDPELLDKYVSPQVSRKPSNRYQALGADAIFLFGESTSVPDFTATFVQEYSLVEAPVVARN